jgi:nucleotide-binding universal stress UspA family protein
MFDCILVSLDGSLAAEAVLPDVENMLRIYPADVVLLRVGHAIDLDSVAHEVEPEVEQAVDLPTDEYDLLANASELEIRRYLDAVAERLARTGAKVICEVGFAKPVDEILLAAHRYNVNLIAMATHARTGFSRLLRGSVTESVMHHAPCPMLIVRTSQKVYDRFAPLKTGDMQEMQQY